MRTSTMMLAAVMAVAMVASAQAHTCLLNPMQRGGAANATTVVADPLCGVGIVPCGGTKVGPAQETYTMGTSAKIRFIKNLNHYNAAAPGNFTLMGWYMGNPGPILATIPDTDSPSLTEYETSIYIPEAATPGDYVLQLIYYTGRGFQFYQCADVALVSSSSSSTN